VLGERDERLLDLRHPAGGTEVVGLDSTERSDGLEIVGAELALHCPCGLVVAHALHVPRRQAQLLTNTQDLRHGSVLLPDQVCERTSRERHHHPSEWSQAGDLLAVLTQPQLPPVPAQPQLPVPVQPRPLQLLSL
jgi:hypothetical protein